MIFTGGWLMNYFLFYTKGENRIKIITLEKYTNQRRTVEIVRRKNNANINVVFN